jgi:hypothetical protein
MSDKTEFNKIISIIFSDPFGEELDKAKFNLVEFNLTEYYLVIDLLNNPNLDLYIKSYLVEAIEIWNSIDLEIRIKDIEKLLNREELQSVYKKTLEFTYIQLLTDKVINKYKIK